MDGVTVGTLFQAGTALLAVVAAVWTVRRDGDAREARVVGRIDILVDRVGALEADVRASTSELRASLTAIASRVDAHDREHTTHRAGLQSQGVRIGGTEVAIAVHEHRLGVRQ